MQKIITSIDHPVVPIRLVMTSEERDQLRRVAAAAGKRSMAAYVHDLVIAAIYPTPRPVAVRPSKKK